MKKGLLKTTAIALSFAAVIVATPYNGRTSVSSAETEVLYKAVRSTLSVEKTEDASVYDNLSVLEFSAAKGETEGAQFFVRSESDIYGYELTASDLKNGNAVISAENVDIYTEIFTEVSGDARFIGSRGAGYYPDCLIPADLIKSRNENNVEAGCNQGFWVDVKVPENAAAGEYAGKITFKANNIVKEIPVRLTVFDFEMPESPALKTCYLIWNDWLMDSELDNTSEKHRAYYDMLLKYNISGYTFPTADVAEFIDYLVENYDNLNCYGIPYRAIDKYTNDWDYYYSYVYAIGEQCLKDNKNYFEKAYYYFDIFYDEFPSFDWRIAQVLRIFGETDAAENTVIEALGGDGFPYAETLRNLRHAITIDQVCDWAKVIEQYPAGEQYSELKTVEDVEKHVIYIPIYQEFMTSVNLEKYGNMISGGNLPVYAYATELHDYPTPAVNISDYQVTGRDIYWFNYAMGIDGELYWCVNGHVHSQSVQGLRYETVEDPYHYAIRGTDSNGGGYYLYPGLHYGSETPFPSMRLAIKRDGIDDYTYMSVLDGKYKTLANRYGAEMGAKNIVSFLSERLTSGVYSKLNDDGLVAARKNLAELIAFADEYGFAIADAEYKDDKINLTLYVNSGVAVTVNGKSAIGTSLGQGVKINVKADYSENGLLTLTCDKGDGAKSIVFNVKSTPKLISGFEAVGNKITVREDRGCITERQSSVVHGGLYGKQVILSGWTDSKNNNSIKTYKPEMTISLADHGVNGDNVSEMYFYVYNDSEDREYEVIVKAILAGDSGERSFVADTVVLKHGVWTKIDVSSFYFISLDNEFTVTGIGLRTDNMYFGRGVKGDPVYTATLFVDDFYTVGK